MSNIHHIHGEAAPSPQPKSRGSYRKKATSADITRAIRAAEMAGLTVYGFTVEGESVQLQTRPGQNAIGNKASLADDYFNRRG